MTNCRRIQALTRQPVLYSLSDAHINEEFRAFASTAQAGSPPTRSGTYAKAARMSANSSSG